MCQEVPFFLGSEQDESYFPIMYYPLHCHVFLCLLIIRIKPNMCLGWFTITWDKKKEKKTHIAIFAYRVPLSVLRTEIYKWNVVRHS